MISRTLYKSIIRILIHQAHLIGISPCALFLRFLPGPQPGCVHMGMADKPCIRGRRSVWPGKHLFQNGIRFLYPVHKHIPIHIFKIIIKKSMDIQKSPHHCRPAETALIQRFRHLVGNLQIIIKISQFFPFNTNIHPFINNLKFFRLIVFKGLGSFHKVMRIILNCNLNGFIRFRISRDQITVMVAMAVRRKFGRKITIRFPIHPQHPLVGLNLGPEEQSFPSKPLRNLVTPPKPDIDPFSFIDRSLWAGTKT